MAQLWRNKALLCVLFKAPKCDFKSELNHDDEICGKETQRKVDYIRADFMDMWDWLYLDKSIWFEWTLSQFIE